jgi:hypothetical protein
MTDESEKDLEGSGRDLSKYCPSTVIFELNSLSAMKTYGGVKYKSTILDLPTRWT